MSSELKIFHALNCSLCESPYSKSSNDPKYPCRLFLCGKVICKECWEKEKPLKKHQCEFQLTCSCPFSACFLRDVLKHPSIIESPNGNGWLLSEPIITNLPKCPKCDVKYSMENDESNPYVLYCGHAICTKCSLTHREADPSSPGFYGMKCSICNDSYRYSKSDPIEMRNKWLRVKYENYSRSMSQGKTHVEGFLLEFVRELPELIEQIPKVKEIRIKSIVDPYREKFAKMDQELEEKFGALEESLNKANGTV